MNDDIKAGDKLFYVPSEHRFEKPHWVEITKVGRKWLHYGFGSRVYKNSLMVDGGNYSSPGLCYRTEEEYIEQKSHNIVWREFRNQILQSYNPIATRGTIEEAAALLGIELNFVRDSE